MRIHREERWNFTSLWNAHRLQQDCESRLLLTHLSEQPLCGTVLQIVSYKQFEGSVPSVWMWQELHDFVSPAEFRPAGFQKTTGRGWSSI